MLGFPPSLVLSPLGQCVKNQQLSLELISRMHGDFISYTHHRGLIPTLPCLCQHTVCFACLFLGNLLNAHVPTKAHIAATEQTKLDLIKIFRQWFTEQRSDCVWPGLFTAGSLWDRRQHRPNGVLCFTKAGVQSHNICCNDSIELRLELVCYLGWHCSIMVVLHLCVLSDLGLMLALKLGKYCQVVKAKWE